MLVKTLTANYEYCRNNTDNLPLPVQKHLSGKVKIFFGFVIAFFKSALNFQHFGKKFSMRAQLFRKFLAPKDVDTCMHKRFYF